MRQSVGYTTTLNIVIAFIIIIFAVFGMSLAYYRSYKVSNKITESIEKYEGYNSLSEAEIKRNLSALGYNWSSVTCKQTRGDCTLFSVQDSLREKEDGVIETTSSTGELGYCVYTCPTNKENYVKYKVTTNMMWNIPLIDDILNIPVETKTRELYGFWNLPAVEKVCTVAKQDESKYSVGDVVTCELSESTDRFYIIEEQPLTAPTVQMLTENNISITTNRQSDNAEKVRFSNADYWSSSVSSYPAWVYDSNSNLYQYVSAYETYLKESGVNSARATLISYEQAKDLKTNKGNPDWFSSGGFWTGSADGRSFMYVVSYGRGMSSSSYSNDYGVMLRPVVIISTSEI